jgi:hypothetical protein
MTEILSLFEMITFPAILGMWILFCVIGISCLIYLFLMKRKLPVVNITEKFSWLNRLILIVIIFILATTLVIAVSAPPNNYDSLTYHMARVAHWIQQQSIKYYPTAIERQNYAQPLTEYMILHLQILTRSDLYANLVQWSGYLIAILIAMEIGRLLNASLTGQLLGALFTATLPMAILQSSSTQTDLMTGVFCLIFVYYLIQVVQSIDWSMILLGGISLGLAILTKGTAYIFGAALGLMLGGVGLIKANKSDRLPLIKGFIVLILIALIMNAGIYYRNSQLYSHPIFTETDRITNDRITIGVLYANVIRNGAIQIAVPFPAINKNITSIVSNHLGDAVSDPDSTFIGSSFQVLYRINEDEAGSLFHFVIFLIVLAVILWQRRHLDGDHLYYGAGIFLSFILYSLAFKWQPWGSRLLLPVYLFAAPWVGSVLDRIQISKVFLWLVVIGFSFSSIPFLTLNETRPLVPIFKKNSPLRSNHIRRFFSDRPEMYEEYKEIISPLYMDRSVIRTDRQIQYFTSISSSYEDYKIVMDEINQLDIDVVGLHLGDNDLEYPIWVMSNRHTEPGIPIFRHVGIDGVSKSLDTGDEENPRYVLSTRMEGDESINGVDYSIVIDTPTIDLLER